MEKTVVKLPHKIGTKHFVTQLEKEELEQMAF
jgi:hypothetical protein